jgi:NAD(P)-dependent dehydrogenase (short-subunit alcohol dehydrogenase family)
VTGPARTALVTGSAGGIGREIALALQAAGLQVVGADRLAQTDGALARTLVVDLADAAACEAAVAEVGGVDVLVNNASVLVDRPLEDMELADFDRLFSVNLRAPVLLTRAVLPGMVERGWGRIVNLSSVGARTGGMSQSAVYNMTKAGVGSFTRFVARHYAAHGITSNAVAPGGVETGMTAHLTDEMRAAIVRQIPVGRMALPVEVAHAVTFLVSDGAAFVNGVTLDVNGGWVMA